MHSQDQAVADGTIASRQPPSSSACSGVRRTRPKHHLEYSRTCVLITCVQVLGTTGTTWRLADVACGCHCFADIGNDPALPISTSITVRASRLSFIPSDNRYTNSRGVIRPISVVADDFFPTLTRQSCKPSGSSTCQVPGDQKPARDDTWYGRYTHRIKYWVCGSCSMLLVPLHLYGHRLYSHLLVFLAWSPEVAQCQV